MNGQEKLSLWSVKGPNKANEKTFWFGDYSSLKDGAFTAVKRDAAF